ncbi:UL15 [Gallid alphaherpesvirus 2]|uniref:UL15 n=1 Tax=Gallid alphaherpesvirus 2 TaxID=10390 RepID=H6WUU6_9ALPH|nr:UL15 [Gallid alphaherpesvirus 2]
MFGGLLGEETKRHFERLMKTKNDRLGASHRNERPIRDGDMVDAPFLNFAIPVPRRHQTVMPAIGILHNCCDSLGIYSAITTRMLYSSIACSEFDELRRDSVPRCYPRITNAQAFLSPMMMRVANSIIFQEYDEMECAAHRNAYYSTMNSFISMRTSDAFKQLTVFISRFSKLLIASFRDVNKLDDHTVKKRARIDAPSYDKLHGTLELFQKMILMHATYFVTSVLLGDHAERAERLLRVAFDTPHFSDIVTRHFRQRATVFLVPRRHGKTWFLVPLIALAMSSFEGIRIGYTSHIRKAIEPVFEDIGDRLRRWFGAHRVDHVKGETITFSFPSGLKSTVTFASSHNTNSIRGQDFNLLFVDEANFIRPDAVQTIIGFLNQATCKIIFVSSTNSGKASTSFLYGLKGSADDLLNVVTYICDEHMKHVTDYTNATSCSCYVLNKPVFITMDGAMRRTAEMFLPDSFMQEIIGGGVVDRTICQGDRSIFTASAIDRFLIYRPSTVNNQDPFSQDLYVYVDPAFTANTKASGTGVAVIGKYGTDYIVFGLEHYFLRALTGESSDSIGYCVAQCLIQICAIHRKRFGVIKIAIEGNSNQDSAVAIATRIAIEMISYMKAAVAPTPHNVSFYHSKSNGTDVEYPYFLLQRQKTTAFDFFIAQFNSGRVLASQDLVSTTVSLTTDPVEYLTKQLTNISEVVTGPTCTRTFSGKKGGNDDTVVALTMAVYISAHIPDMAFAPIRV